MEELEYARLQVDLYDNRLEQIRSIHQECDDPIDWQEVYHRPPHSMLGRKGQTQWLLVKNNNLTALACLNGY